MSASAIAMMLIAMTTVWGGLVWAVWNLKQNPDELDEQE